jgi:hypothetical protein
MSLENGGKKWARKMEARNEPRKWRQEISLENRGKK